MGNFRLLPLTQKMQKPHSLVLSFRADGPYWSDLVHILAYPEGISHLWPFRYNAERIEQSLRAELDDARSRRAVFGSSALIAARFHTASADDRLLPIRYATIIHVDVSAGIYSFTFRLGQPLKFSDAPNLQGCTVQTNQHVDFLAFRENVCPQIPTASDPELVGICWKSFAHLIAQETMLPINDEAKRSLFIHISAPAEETVPAPLHRVHKTSSGADVYGFRLKEGRKYELKYSHYVPVLEGANTTIREIDIEPKFASQNLEINTTEATLIGNYGTQSLVFGAVNPTAVWHDFAIAPKEKKLTSQTQGININTHRMQIPVAVSWSFGLWLWRTFVPMMVLFFAFAALGTATIIERNLPKLLDGSLTWSQVAENWLLILIVVIGSSLASIAILVLQTRKKPK